MKDLNMSTCDFGDHKGLWGLGRGVRHAVRGSSHNLQLRKLSEGVVNG